MIVIRNIKLEDLDGFHKLAKKVGVGLTSLPPDKDILLEKIQLSMESIATQDKQDGYYLFVMEDLLSKRIVGCCGIIAKVGQRRPFYSYKLSNITQVSEEFGINEQTQLLNLVNDYQGSTELCSLFLLRDMRKLHFGKMLSLSRFLFMAQHPQRFAPQVIAELRGVSDRHGNSPFWDNLGKHFFGIDFVTADRLTGMGKKQFIAELMPKYPVYVNLLSEHAQAVIAKPHNSTRPAMRMLEHQGFHFNGYVDIFDGGPTVEAYLSSIRSIRRSRVVKIKSLLAHPDGEPHLLANTNLDFRLVMGMVKGNNDSVEIYDALAQQLQVDVGDEIRVLALE